MNESFLRKFAEMDVVASQEPTAQKSAGRLRAGAVLRDRFSLEEQLADTGAGTVYKALDRCLTQADGSASRVLINVLSAELLCNAKALRALQQEASKVRSLSHPGIVRFLDLDCDGELHFVVMEWFEGRSLGAILDDPQSQTMEISAALDIVSQLAQALDYAHQRGVVHADLSPASVIVMPCGQVKLFDFGIARVRQKQSDTVTRLRTAALSITTPAYSSMQVLTGDEPVPADDVFSLACLFYRLVAGFRVFGQRDAAEAVEAGMDPRRPQSLNNSQWKALRKGLSYTRVTRYGSLQTFVDDLRGPAVIQNEIEQLQESSDDTETLPIVVANEMQSGTRGKRISRHWLYGLALAGVAMAQTYVGLQSGVDKQAVSVADIENVASAAGTGGVGEQPSAPEPLPQALAVTGPGADAVDVAGEIKVAGGTTPSEEVATDVLLHEPRLGVAITRAQPVAERQTVAMQGEIMFWLDQLVVQEGDQVIEIDVLRLDPTDRPLNFQYRVHGNTAVEGKDYTAPSAGILSFAADQSIARIQILLLDDSISEYDEMFLVEIISTASEQDADTNHRITVIIQDDDIAAQ